MIPVTADPQGTVYHINSTLLVDADGVLLPRFYCQSQFTKCFFQFRCITVDNGAQQLVDSLPECINVTALAGMRQPTAMHGQFNQ